jgi:signal transduction histidine kinase
MLMPDESSYSSERVLSRFVLDRLPEPIIVLDRAGRPIEVNHAARSAEHGALLELFRRDVSEARTSAFLNELRARGRATMALAQAAAAPGGNVVIEGFAVDPWFVVRVRDNPYENAVHDLKKEICHLRQTESVGVMAASVIHDLNNLLTPMLCFSAALTSEVEPSNPLAPLLADIDSLANRAAALTRDVLTYARPKTSSPESLNASAVVATMRPLIERLFGGSAELVFSLEEDLGETRVERARLEHALLNLLANARNAMPHGGKLTVSTANLTLSRDQKGGKGNARYVSLSVCDTGIGMTEEVGAHAFDDFFTTRTGTGGTGLGLTSVKRFVNESGGFVRLESEVGLGTTVCLCLPRIEG